MNKTTSLFFAIFGISFLFAQNPQLTPFEKAISEQKNENYSASYPEIVEWYKKWEKYPEVKWIEAGTTDIGKPLHTLIIDLDKDFEPMKSKRKGKCILLINNGIHPGEPEGIDASMMLVRDLLTKPELREKLKHLVVVIIPVYNVDGCLNRSSTSRANQNGPAEYGFRGNAKNLDLNRDFIKTDSKNAQSFNKIFSYWKPHIFMDNHTSDGADYQYTMTIVATQKDKLQSDLGTFLDTKLTPYLYENMKKRSWEMSPYVNTEGALEQGIYGFLDNPRYSTGYAALHNAIGFMPETHMLKPFKDRVYATYALMQTMIEFMNDNYIAIRTLRGSADASAKNQQTFPLSWEVDTLSKQMIDFKGFEAKYKLSEVSGLQRLYYDRNAPYQKSIPYYNSFKATLSVEKPMAYIIPQAYSEIIEKLKNNQIEMQPLAKDEEIEVEMYYIRDFKTGQRPYEKHYVHSNVKVEKVKMKRKFYAGDMKVLVNQSSNRYIVETLEPEAPDSFFAWGSFDNILQQKEYYSDYVFEDVAADILAKNPALREELEAKKKNDAAFAQNAEAQLDWVYYHSPYYEKTHNLYPIARVK
jgi:hypothetical protein